MKLELITGETCARKVKVLKSPYSSSEEERTCRNNCEQGYNLQCPNYTPVKSTQIPIRQGRFACLT